MPEIPKFGPPASEGGVWHAQKNGTLKQVVKPPMAPIELEAAEAAAEPTPPETSAAAATPSEETA